MNLHPQWEQALFDHALGEPAGAELEAHLAACPECAAALEELRARAGMLDSTVREVAAQEPRPEAAQRVMARIGETPAPRPVLRWASATMAATAAVVGLWMWSGHGRPPASTLSNWRSPTESLLRSPADPLLKSVPRVGDAYFEWNNPGGNRAR
jgi:hypothetical protein